MASSVAIVASRSQSWSIDLSPCTRLVGDILGSRCPRPLVVGELASSPEGPTSGGVGAAFGEDAGLSCLQLGPAPSESFLFNAPGGV